MPQQESLLRAGIAAMKAGNKQESRQLLTTVVEQDPGCEEAWLWLAATAPSPRESLTCLKRVLAINPQNAKAAAGVRAVTAQLEHERRSAKPSPVAPLLAMDGVTQGTALPPAEADGPTPAAHPASQTMQVEPVLETAPGAEAAQQPPVATTNKQGRFFPNLVVSVLVLLLLLGLVIIAALAYTGWR